jgi:hypothetical protein
MAIASHFAPRMMNHASCSEADALDEMASDSSALLLAFRHQPELDQAADGPQPQCCK